MENTFDTNAKYERDQRVAVLVVRLGAVAAALEPLREAVGQVLHTLDGMQSDDVDRKTIRELLQNASPEQIVAAMESLLQSCGGWEGATLGDVIGQR